VNRIKKKNSKEKETKGQGGSPGHRREVLPKRCGKKVRVKQQKKKRNTLLKERKRSDDAPRHEKGNFKLSQSQKTSLPGDQGMKKRGKPT